MCNLIFFCFHLNRLCVECTIIVFLFVYFRCDIALVASNAEKLEESRSLVEKEGKGKQYLTFAVDLRDEKATKEVFQQIGEKFKKV